jgi:DNA-binding NarL/FixJ family response regulator
MAEERPRDIALVVDDSPDTLGLLTESLEEAGFTVLVALTGNSALALVEEVTPDVILLDAVMPGVDGFDTCRRLKGLAGLAYVPVIFMTGLSETENVVRGLEAGGVDYVTKPIVAEELVARIRVHLNNARLGLSARAALDAAGRFLLATDRSGKVLWSTPQANRLLAMGFADFAGQGCLPAACLDGSNGEQGGEGVVLLSERLQRKVRVTLIGQIGANEFLLRVAEEGQGSQDVQRLKERFSLTARESEVLFWLAGGKSNRDIGTILGLSPRTINKHLEQVFSKLRVENRTTAATLALRSLGNP